MKLRLVVLCSLILVLLVTAQSPEKPAQAGPEKRPSGLDGVYTTNPNLAIPDSANTSCNIVAGAAAVTTLNISDSGIVQDLGVILNISHGWSGDLQVFLESPQGTTVELVEGINVTAPRGTGSNGGTGNGCGCGNDNIVTDLDDEGINGSIETTCPANVASLTPYAALTAFNGEEFNGTWTLRVYDWTGIDSGVINTWGLAVNYTLLTNTPSDTPIPTDTNTPGGPTNTPTPTDTNTPSSPTFTFTPSITPTPSVTLCPMVATPPNLISPAHRAHTTDRTPQFRWSNVGGAESFRLMVYLEDRSFEYKKRVFVNQYTLQTSETLARKKYLWRVRTQDTFCDKWTTWSQRNTLFID